MAGACATGRADTAALPCKSCEEKLVAAIKAGEGKTTLGELNVETTILKNYFAWAGTK